MEDDMQPWVRGRLEQAGYLREEGDFGAALTNFQRTYSLPMTGWVDPNTVAELSQRRCGVPDHPVGLLGAGDTWPSPNLTYWVWNNTPNLRPTTIARVVARSFETWAAVTRLSFRSKRPPVTFDVRFAAGNHGDDYPFDGPGGVLAHAFYPPPSSSRAGDIHFDNAERWTVRLPVPSGGADLETIAIHEIGHALGLGHSNDPSSIMYPTYRGAQRSLSLEDVQRIQALYGTAPSPPTPPAPPPPANPWDDPRVRAFIDEWLGAVNRCFKRIEPRARITKWGVVCGRLQNGGVIACNHSGPPGQTHWQVLWTRNWTYRNYSRWGARDYALARLQGRTKAELAPCG